MYRSPSYTCNWPSLDGTNSPKTGLPDESTAQTRPARARLPLDAASAASAWKLCSHASSASALALPTFLGSSKRKPQTTWSGSISGLFMLSSMLPSVAARSASSWLFLALRRTCAWCDHAQRVSAAVHQAAQTEQWLCVCVCETWCRVGRAQGGGNWVCETRCGSGVVETGCERPGVAGVW